MNECSSADVAVSLAPQQIETILRAVPGGSENIQGIYPLSPLQAGMLFHYLLDTSGDTYILSTLFELQSALHVRALVHAVARVTDRHDMLRSCFVWERLPEPVQVVQRQVPVRADALQLEQGRDALEQIEALMKPGKAGMNLQQAPLLRLTTATDERTNKCYVLLQIHHLICDYRSWHLVVREVLSCVSQRELPAAVPRPERAARPLTNAQRQQAEAFFRAKLSHIDEPVAPFGELDIRRGASQVAAATRVLDPLLSQQLRSRARIAGSSVARLLHATWALVVATTSQRDEVVFGTALSTSRGAMRSLAAVTMAVNTLPICLKLRDLSVQQLIVETHRELEELLRYEHAPLTLAQHCSAITGTAPLFTALLNYRHAASRAVENCGPDAQIRVVAHGEAWTNYPIALTVDDDGDEITLIAQTRGAIDPNRVAAHVETTVRSLTEALEHAPNTPALSLTVLPPAERQFVLRGLNATQVAYDRRALIHELFEAQAQKTPHAFALLHGQRSMTYAELNGKANQLARYLRECGARPDRLVAICVERGLGMVVGLLAILKAGAAYLPLDPTYPPERLRYMLDDARPSIALFDDRTNLPFSLVGTRVVRLDEQLRRMAGSSAQNLPATELNLNSDHLLYVIYTSGSTGSPKGTAMPHGSMVNLIEWHRRELPAGGVRVLQFAALSFDVAFQEVFSTLCTGGQLVLIDEAVRRDPRALIELLQRQRVARIFLPPVMLQTIAEQFKTAAAGLESLQDVITAGEQLRISAEIVDFFERLPGCRLHNHYGPTETHVVTALTLAGRPIDWPKLPSIGKPIANTQIYILDRCGQPVPLAAAGEIFIGGANVARGYLNRLQLSAERFVPNPFSVGAGERMYKTGDLGRWLADGTVEYLGRNDDQVKIRGFRVELGEVEAQLAKQHRVKEVVVVAREDVRGSRCLVAYLTLRDCHGGGVDELRRFAVSVLPEHMVPSAYVILERLPLTPSGKIARRALPAPAPEAYVRADHEAPQGRVEQELERIWRELLHIDRVGRHDNFFALGGHSLLGVRLVTAVETSLGVRLPVVAVFQHPTLAALAVAINSSASDQYADPDGEFEEGIISVDSASRPDGVVQSGD